MRCVDELRCVRCMIMCVIDGQVCNMVFRHRQARAEADGGTQTGDAERRRHSEGCGRRKKGEVTEGRDLHENLLDTPGSADCGHHVEGVVSQDWLRSQPLRQVSTPRYKLRPRIPFEMDLRITGTRVPPSSPATCPQSATCAHVAPGSSAPGKRFREKLASRASHSISHSVAKSQ